MTRLSPIPPIAFREDKKLLFKDARTGWRFWICGFCLAFLAITGRSVPAFDTTTPASFFTNVADLVLRDETANWQAQNFAAFTNTFGATMTNAFGVSNIPVYINGNFVYSSSVQRLLQVTANIYEAMSTNTYPAVYRPTFYLDPASSNVFINGYQQVANISGGISDYRLTQPLDVSTLARTNFPTLSDVGPGSPAAMNNVNVYGIPWIIGARKGFPSFNELNLLNSVQISRYIQVNRSSTNNWNLANYTTNQMYVLTITNSLGVSLWNSYNNQYTGSGQVSIYAQGIMQATLTNASAVFSTPLNYFTYYQPNVSPWSGSLWINHTSPSPASFYFTNWTLGVVPPSVYQFPSQGLLPIGNTSPFPSPYFQNVTFNYSFPQFGYMTTNRLQAFILDGSNVVDYVQFSGPNNARNLTAELADPNYPDGTTIRYMWSTNTFPTGNGAGGAPPYGEVNQIELSRGVYPYTAAPPGGRWVTGVIPGGPYGDVSPPAQQAFFGGFFAPYWTYNGVKYANTEYTVLAPYTPTRTMVDYTLWQANDPLVHYLATDLTYYDPGYTGLKKSDYMPPVFTLPGLSLGQLASRYQPWGVQGQLAGLAGVDFNTSNYAYKDPLIYDSDSWLFPTNQTWNPDWLGQIHRGTPWQTVFLKSTNLLDLINFQEGLSIRSVANGLPTWVAWTGNADSGDAVRAAPASDWHLAGLLTALLNTNASSTYFSINNTNANAWTTEFDGLTAVTNLVAGTSLILSSNAPAVASVAAAIESMRAGEFSRVFQDVGDVFATPQLSVQSPFLDRSDPISDAEYEALPSQLLSQLGLASQGALVFTNGQWVAQFTGAVGHLYELQSSPDLCHWTNLGTNSPVNGQVNFLIAPATAGTPQFYRSQFLP